MNKLYEIIISKLNKEEQNTCEYLVYENDEFLPYNKKQKKDNLCLNVKLKINRFNDFTSILDTLNIEYKVTNDNEYYKILELNEKKNYIVIDYVVNSHIVIPQTILKGFGYRKADGDKIDYIDNNDNQIKSDKVKNYGTVYGYYPKIIEDKLSQKFEDGLGRIKKEFYEFSKEKIKIINLPDKKIIMDFFDITSYRNPKALEEFNKNSLTSLIVGGYTHDFLISVIISGNFPNIYKDLEVNFIINKTDADFIINDTMISTISIDNGNPAVILPITPKVCIALLEKDYYKKYMKDEYLYYMKIDNPSEVEEINKKIYKFALANQENVIGNKLELSKLLDEEK